MLKSIRLAVALTWLLWGTAGGVSGSESEKTKDSVIAQLKAQLAEKEVEIAALKAAGPKASLEWRAQKVDFIIPMDEGARAQIDNKLREMSEQGYTAAVWLGGFQWENAVWPGGHELWLPPKHTLLRLKEFPEAQELSEEQVERNIKQMKWLLRRAKELGMDNFLYTMSVLYTPAFSKAHGLDKPLPVSEKVSISQSLGYAGMHSLGVWNELTRAYTESVFAEMAKTYEDLDGFYTPIGEPLPGKRSKFYKEAIVPGLKRSGRKPLMIAHQWEVPLEDYLEDIAPKEVYDNTWLSCHGYNAEQLTDAKPYPYIAHWAEKTGLPTVASMFPGNTTGFLFNSPRYACEIVSEMKKIPNFRGFLWFDYSNEDFTPLFRHALAYYGKRDEAYSDEPWLEILEKQFGDHQAAKHFLNAYNISGRIIPETCALVWEGHGDARRLLRMSYDLFPIDGPERKWNLITSRVRSEPLTPVWFYARRVAQNPAQYRDNTCSFVMRNVEGADDNYRQITSWRTEGGSTYDIIPPVHMAKVREMGQQCRQEAELAMKTVKQNREEAQLIYHWMKSYELLTRYYELKVATAIEAMVYAQSHKLKDKTAAEKLADQALAGYLDAANYMHEHLDPVIVKRYGQPMKMIVNMANRQQDLPMLIAAEKEDRQKIGKIFNWPK